jgi:protein ImuA
MKESREDIIMRLRKDVLFQRFSTPKNKHASSLNIPPLTSAFHFNLFPTGAVHEFICNDKASAAASTGFLSGLLNSLMKNKGTAIWISPVQHLFPPAFVQYGISPHHIIFIQLCNQKDILFAMEEALKCEGLSAVIADVKYLNFKQSRRLQLACEQSKVTGFILCHNPNVLNTTACVARWKITPSPSIKDENMPGVGFPSWHIQLLKVKNGKPGSWVFSWQSNRFIHIPEQAPSIYIPQKKAV